MYYDILSKVLDTIVFNFICSNFVICFLYFFIFVYLISVLVILVLQLKLVAAVTFLIFI